MRQLLQGLKVVLARLGQPMLLVAVVLAAGLVAAVVLLRPMLPTWVWLSNLCVLVLCILIATAMKVLPWYRERRFVRVHDGVAADGSTGPGRDLERRLVAARDVILESPKLAAGRDPLYRLPWYLVLGAEDSATQSLLRPPLADSPFSEPEAGERVWSWWFYKGLVAIQVPSTFVCDPHETEVRGVWYQALRLLDRHRPKLPVNGFIVVLGAGEVTGAQDALRETCTRLRRLVDEALRLLQIEAPVYVMVAGCETLPGFDAFAHALPAGARRRVLGHRFKTRDQTGRALREWLASGFDDLRHTLHATRLGLLADTGDARTRRGLLSFVETFEHLKGGLEEVASALFEDNTYQRQPMLTGLFFTCGDGFSGDLFDRFLPAGQPLARKRRRSRLFRWSAALAVAGLLLAGSALLVRWILAISNETERLVAAAEEACQWDGQPAESMAALDACREAIDRLVAARLSSLFDPGRERTSRAEKDLKDRYVTSYDDFVTEPLERATDSAIRRRALEFSDHLALARRYALVRQCLEGGQCGTLDVDPVFEAALVADVPGLRIPDDLPVLSRLHVAGLRWMSEQALAAHAARITARLEAAHGAQPLLVSDIAAWAEEHAAPIGLQQFWRRPGPAEAPQVPPAFRYVQWTDGPARLAADVAGTSVAPGVRAVLRDYVRSYASSWREFLAGFDLGALAWSEDVPGLVALLGSDSSPYHKLWRTLEQELFPLKGERSMPPWPAALASTLEGPWKEVEPKLRALFFELDDDLDGLRGYELASAVYGGETAPDPTVTVFQEVQAALETPPLVEGALSIEGQLAWRVVRQPLELWLRIVNHGAGVYIDRMWRERVVEPAQAQPDRERQNFLFGPDGRVAAFRKTVLRPLLAESGAAGRLGVASPVADAFQAFLDSPETAPAPGGPIYAGRLAISRPADLGTLSGAPGSTSFTLACLSGNQTANDGNPQQAMITIAWSPDDCFDVRITVDVPASLMSDAVLAGTLVRTYAGPDGFIDFIADFRTGPRTMSLGAFSVTPAVRSALESHGVAQVTLPIELDLSEDMKAWLAGPPPARLPVRVGASMFDSSNANSRLQ